MTTCKQGSQLHVLKWEACRNGWDGGDPVTLFLHIPDLININKNKKRETKISISSDPLVSCHADISRATYVKSFLIRGSFMWHYCFLALGSSSTARTFCGSFAAVQQMSQPCFILLCVCCRMLYTNSPEI